MRLPGKLILAFCILFAVPAWGQVYAPLVLRDGQADASDLHRLAQAIYLQAGAHTPREKAEAIWRFFLTDGRFVKPGLWYHIAGWSYEEPGGEVLDPLKLLNSYGFGLCYHIAPLLAAVFDAGGFEDSRVWFLTGHTVTEVFYDGAYHYYDSDMMGYSTLGPGSPATSVVASVHQIERDGSIVTSRLNSPREVNPALVDYPWYPADVHAAAIGDLAGLFTSSRDNRLFVGKRYQQGHSMRFTLRPGERMVRYFRPEEKGLAYLPYQFRQNEWSEFPQPVAEYAIRTEDGPRSQKDARGWATGHIEYEPDLTSPLPAETIVEMPCPYVVIDAAAEIEVNLASSADTLEAATSIDGGQTWQAAGHLAGPHSGSWKVEAATLTGSAHGHRSTVSGSYGYLLRLKRSGAAKIDYARVITRFQLNPRTLPQLQPGENRLSYSAGLPERSADIGVVLSALDRSAARVDDAEYVDEGGQGFVRPKTAGEAILLFEVCGRDGAVLSSLRAGGRFLDIRDGLAPDKFTAEVRQTSHAPVASGPPSAALEWSLARTGPFTPLWTYDPDPKWRDGDPIDRLLRWPEVDRSVTSLPAGTRSVWVRYRLRGMALDNVRLGYTQPGNGESPLEITHVWTQGGQRREHKEKIRSGLRSAVYEVRTSGGEPLQNEALILACPRTAR